MKKFVLLSLVTVLLAVPACKRSGPVAVIREPNVYLNEIDVNTMIHNQAAGLLKQHLEASCTCKDGKWETEVCEKTAKHILVVESRVPYIVAMQEYNGSFTEERPPETPPEVPETSTLCSEAPAEPEEETPEPEEAPTEPATEGDEG